MKILITNSVPLNGGDEALLRATYLSLKKDIPDAQITVLCKNVEDCRNYIKDITLDTDLEFIQSNSQKKVIWLKYKIRRSLLKFFKLNWNSKFSLLFADPNERRIKALYRNCDIVISSPGGFLHDFYDISQRLDGFQLAVDYGKPVVLFAQSIGPFWKSDSKERVRTLFEKLTAIILREKISLEYLLKIRANKRNIFVLSDAAFLFYKLMPELFVSKVGKVKRIAMCFRKWPSDAQNIQVTLQKATQLCEFLLQEDADREIVFLSTCQGIPNYIDDSINATQIVNDLPLHFQERCTVITSRYSPVELIKEYSQFDAFIGMRLHSAILSMIGGTPALGLAYEDKTEGIFTAMGLEQYQVNFNSSTEQWINSTKKFLEDIPDIREKLPAALGKLSNEADEAVKMVKKIIKNNEYGSKAQVGK